MADGTKLRKTFFDNTKNEITDYCGSSIYTKEGSNTGNNYDYEVYGGLIKRNVADEIDYAFTGQEYDQSTALHNFRARMYDSETGLFYGVDPAGQGNAPFAYCGNNPVMRIDKDGKFAWWIIPAVVGAYLGGSSANNWQMNPFDWNWKQPGQTLLGIAAGGLGGYAAYTGAAGAVGATPFKSVAYALGETLISYGSQEITKTLDLGTMGSIFANIGIKGLLSSALADQFTDVAKVEKYSPKDVTANLKKDFIDNHMTLDKAIETSKPSFRLFSQAEEIFTIKNSNGDIIGATAKGYYGLGLINHLAATTSSAIESNFIGFNTSDVVNPFKASSYFWNGVCHQDMARVLGIVSPIRVTGFDFRTLFTQGVYGAVGGDGSLSAFILKNLNKRYLR